MKKAKHWYDYLWICAILYFTLGFFNILFAWLGMIDFLLPLIENYPPPATKGKYIKIKYVTQLPTPTPQFAFFVNLPQYIKEPYRRFLENNMRDHWDFSGVPVQIYFRQK